MVMAIYFGLLPRFPHAQQIAYFLLSTSVVVAILVGVRIHRPERRAVWYLLAAGQATYAIADGIWNAWEIVSRKPVPFPSLADPLWLASYPLWIAALVLLAHRRLRGRSGGALLDGAIIIGAATLVSWVFLIRPYFVTPGTGTLADVTSIAYPIADLVLIGMIAPMLRVGRRRTASNTFLLAWLLVFFVCDTIYGLSLIHGWYRPGSWLDAGWFLAYLLLGAAALHPSMKATSRVDDIVPRAVGPGRIALLAFASMSGPGMIILGVDGSINGIHVAAMISMILGGLILVRLIVQIRQGESRRVALATAMDQLSHRALHDPLTSLANRTLFADRIEHAAARIARGDENLAVLLLDLDDFKAVNDGMGHEAGDDLLVAVAARLREATREADTIARLGGDEFAVLLEDSGADDAVPAAERILESLRAPFDVGGRTVFIGCSIGIAGHDASTRYAETLQHADVAMYRAKSTGRGRYVVFESSMGEAAVERIELEADMREALNARPHEFVVHYQPIVGLERNDVVGLEALVRWDHPTRGMLPPIDFLPTAEETGLIVPLGRLILREACRQVAWWRRSVPGMQHLNMSVNLSNKQVEDGSLPANIERALADADLEPGALTLELTEDLLLRDVESVETALRSLATLGVRISVDDFGSGNASMSYLKRFPITELKIDKSYVDDLTGAHPDPSLVRGVIALGHAIHLQTVAEGIESPAQLTMLRDLGCQLGQGFLFARPKPAHEIEDLLLTGVGAHPGPLTITVP